MILEHLIIARDSSIDIERNTLSVFDFIEEITIKTNAPRVAFPLQLVVVLKRDKETGKVEGDLTISAKNPSNESIFDLPVHYTMAANHKRARMRIMVELPVSKSGNYCLSVKGDKFSGESSIGVNFETEGKKAN